MAYTNQTKHTATWTNKSKSTKPTYTNKSKNTATWANISKGYRDLLLAEDGTSLKQENNYYIYLEQSAQPTWSGGTKHTASWSGATKH